MTLALVETWEPLQRHHQYKAVGVLVEVGSCLVGTSDVLSVGCHSEWGLNKYVKPSALQRESQVDGRPLCESLDGLCPAEAMKLKQMPHLQGACW